jgi:hypothetical protein
MLVIQSCAFCTFRFSSIGFWYHRSEKYKSASLRAAQLKNQKKTIGIEEKLDIISQLEKGERIVDIWCNVEFAYSRSIQLMIMLIELQKVLS